VHRERGERRDERLILEVIDIYWDSKGAFGLPLVSSRASGVYRPK